MSGGSRPLVVATRNNHKLVELRSILAPAELLELPAEVDLPPETGSTFAENALIKARAAAAATGCDAIADDSGIEAAALGGRPGVRSARYAGEAASDEENLSLLLREVGAHPSGNREVAYVCAMAYVGTDGIEHVEEARCEGVLVEVPRGAGGFGYDPAVVPAATGAADTRTMAELAVAEKDAISHRGQAARSLGRWLGRER